MRYPESLVNEFGAKAGVLLYVAKELPHIPQIKMVAGTPDEPARSLLTRAANAGIGLHRIFRSSAREELDGYEGMFETRVDRGFSQKIGGLWDWVVDIEDLTSGELQSYHQSVSRVIDHIQHPRLHFEPNFYPGTLIPESIGVIIAEYTDSSYGGTLIKHPNQRDTYFISLTTPDGFGEPKSSYVYRPDEGISPVPGTRDGFGLASQYLTWIPQEIQGLREICSWHDQIAGLPEMDPDWTYQIEFGLAPSYLYQVRPFKRIEAANFRLEPAHEPNLLTSIGLTPLEGVELKLFREEKDKEEGLDPDVKYAFYGGMRSPGNTRIDLLSRFGGAILQGESGFLSHQSVRLIKAAGVTVLDPRGTLIDQLHEYRGVKNVRITSDGRLAKVEA